MEQKNYQEKGGREAACIQSRRPLRRERPAHVFRRLYVSSRAGNSIGTKNGATETVNRNVYSLNRVIAYRLRRRLPRQR